MSHRDNTRRLETRQLSGLPQLATSDQKNVKEMVFQLLLLGAAAKHGVDAVDTWDGIVPKVYQSLDWEALYAYIVKTGAIVTGGLGDLAEDITCRLGDWNNKVGGLTNVDCSCEIGSCCPSGGSDCLGDNDDSNSGTTARRDVSPAVTFLKPARTWAEAWKNAKLQPRASQGDPRSYIVNLPDGALVITSFAYPHWTALGRGNPVYDNQFTLPYGADCLDIQPGHDEITATTRGVVVEHPLELGSLPRFMRDAAQGVLPSGATMTFGPVAASFFRQTLHDAAPEMFHRTLPQVPGNMLISVVPIDRIWQWFGSETNFAPFVLTDEVLNNLKGIMWRYGKPFNDDQNEGRDLYNWIKNPSDRKDLFIFLRSCMAVIEYMNHDFVWGRMIQSYEGVREELRIASDIHYATYGTHQNGDIAWQEWFRDHVEFMVSRIQAYLRDCIQRARTAQTGTDPATIEFQQQLSVLLQRVNGLRLPYDQIL